MRSTVPDKITESWVVTWFPPEADRRKAHRSEEAARTWLKSNYEASSWNPILTHEVTEVYLDQSIIPLLDEDLWKEEDDA